MALTLSLGLVRQHGLAGVGQVFNDFSLKLFSVLTWGELSNLRRPSGNHRVHTCILDFVGLEVEFIETFFWTGHSFLIHEFFIVFFFLLVEEIFILLLTFEFLLLFILQVLVIVLEICQSVLDSLVFFYFLQFFDMLMFLRYSLILIFGFKEFSLSFHDSI